MVYTFPASDCEPYCNPNPDYTKLNIYAVADIDKAFDFISKRSSAQFSYPQGGCPERALLIHYLLDSMNITNFRIWLFAPSRLVENNTQKIFIYDKNHLTTGDSNKIEWDFHVAPCVLTKRGDGKIDTLVIDPSINGEEPLPHFKWLNSIGDNEIASYTFLDGKYYMFNKQNGGNSNVINGYFFPYDGVSYNNLWLERFLALNDVAYSMFKTHVEGKDPHSQEVIDIKTVIGNSATLKEVLDYKDGNPQPSKIRSLIKKYPGFILQAWAMYSSRFVYWTNRIEVMKKKN